MNLTAIENQDRATTLGVFHNGDLLAEVPDDDVYGSATRAAVAGQLGLPEIEMEVLKICLDHPETAAVDCLVCAPMEP